MAIYQKVTFIWRLNAFRAIARFVHDIKTKAQEVYTIEHQELQVQEKLRLQQEQQIAASPSNRAQFNPHMMHNKSMGIHSNALMRQKRSTEPLRPLSVLFNCANFFEEVHSLNTTVLKAVYEKVVHTVPWESQLVQNLITTTTTTTNDQNILLTIPPPDLNSYVPVYIRTVYQFVKLLKTYFLQGKQSKNVTPVKTFATEDRDDFLYVNPTSPPNGIMAAQADHSPSLATSPTSADKKQVDIVIRLIIYNLIIGNQIVIRSDNVPLGHDIINVLAKLIPESCVRMTHIFEEYSPCYVANFVVVNEQVQLSELVDYKSTLVMDIFGDFKHFTHVSYKFDGIVRETKLGKDMEALLFKFDVLPKSKRSKKSPMPVADMKEHGNKPDLQHVEMLETHIVANLKQEWLTHAKLLVQLAKRPAKPKTVPTSMSFKASVHPAAQVLHASDEDVGKPLLRILNLHDNDLPVLKYWSTGLKKK